MSTKKASTSPHELPDGMQELKVGDIQNWDIMNHTTHDLEIVGDMHSGMEYPNIFFTSADIPKGNMYNAGSVAKTITK